VVAWWLEDSLGNLEENARAPQQGAQQISLSPAQGVRTFSVLLDPHGSIHATCGVLAAQPDDPTRARVCYPAPPAEPKAPAPQLEDSLKEFPDAIEIARVLKTLSYRLEAPIPGPVFQPLELREGWLRLRRSTP